MLLFTWSPWLQGWIKTILSIMRYLYCYHFLLLLFSEIMFLALSSTTPSLVVCIAICVSLDSSLCICRCFEIHHLICYLECKNQDVGLIIWWVAEVTTLDSSLPGPCSSPVQARASALCSWTWHVTLTMPLYTLVYTVNRYWLIKSREVTLYWTITPPKLQNCTLRLAFSLSSIKR